MAHLLHLRPTARADWPRLMAFFEGRRGYRSVERGLGYENEDTAVSFSLRREEAQLELELNYGRPRSFGLEAAEELRALGQSLRVEMRDAQEAEPERWLPLDPDAFFHSWLPANAFAARHFARSELANEPVIEGAEVERGDLVERTNRAAAALPVLDTVKLERIWRWNFTARERAAQTGTTAVPLIVLVMENDVCRTVARLEASRPSLFPDVDRVWLPRPLLEPETEEERLHAEDVATREGDFIHTHARHFIEHLLTADRVEAGALPAYTPLGADASVTRDLNELFYSQDETLSVIPFDAVMDTQLLRESDGLRTFNPNKPHRREPEPEPVGATRLGRLLRHLGHSRALLTLEVRSVGAVSTAALEAELRKSAHVVDRKGALHYLNTDTGAQFSFERGDHAFRVTVDLCAPAPWVIDELLGQLTRMNRSLGLLARVISATELSEFQPYDPARISDLWRRLHAEAMTEALEVARTVGEPIYAASKTVLDRIHQWNLQRRELEREVGLEVPRIAFSFHAADRRGITTFVRWTRFGPAVLPEVDDVRIPSVAYEQVFPEAAEGDGPPVELNPELGDVLSQFGDHVEALRTTPPVAMAPHHVVRHAETLERLRREPVLMASAEGVAPNWTDAPEIPFADLVPLTMLDHPQRVEAHHCMLPHWEPTA